MRRVFSSRVSNMGVSHGVGMKLRSGRDKHAPSSLIAHGHVEAPFCGPTQKHAAISPSSSVVAGTHHPD